MNHPHSDDEPHANVCHPEPTVQGGRYDGMPLRQLEMARMATCSRCSVVIVDAPSAAGALMLNTYSPATSTRMREFLCGECGLLLREFLHPELLSDPLYRSSAAGLRKSWGSDAARG